MSILPTAEVMVPILTGPASFDWNGSAHPDLNLERLQRSGGLSVLNPDSVAGVHEVGYRDRAARVPGRPRCADRENVRIAVERKPHVAAIPVENQRVATDRLHPG